MPRIVIGDGALYYERQGVGFPVLFISGLSGFASFWQDQVAAFARKFDVVTHDHRGIGQSDVTRSGFTVDRMAADVVGLMDALEIERAHIVGHSTGGAIAQILAIEHPKRLASVVLSATWTKPDAYFRRMFGLRKDILSFLGQVGGGEAGKDSIGMMTMNAKAFSTADVKMLTIDNIAATRETLANGTYPIRRPLFFVYNTEPAKVKPTIKAFIDFVKGPEGQKILAGL